MVSGQMPFQSNRYIFSSRIVENLINAIKYTTEYVNEDLKIV